MPKVKTLQIVWHEKEPVYSLDFHPDGTLYTAGADKEIKAWEVSRGEDGYANVKHTGTLTGHTKTVNCIRFSPSGKHLVSSGDSGEMLLWQPQASDAASRGNLVSADESNSGWRRSALLSGHGDDVMDVAWSPDGSALMSGSIDNKVIVWEISEKKRGQMITQLANHKHFVQGVAWDPIQQFVISQSADRTCKVYALRPPPAGRKNKISQYLQPAAETAKELYCAHTLSKRIVAQQAQQGGATASEDAPKPERLPLFLDESAPTFFRRPSWSPDGSFLALPAGTHRSSSPTGPRDLNTVYLYARGQWAAPIAHLPAQSSPVVAVRFCPVLFRKDPTATSPAPFDKLPYKMVFAIATLHNVVLYDTTSVLPIAVLGNLHYDSITELAWSKDGQYLAVASRDCYCSIAAFDKGELGERLPESELPVALTKFAAAKEAAAAVPAAVKSSPAAGVVAAAAAAVVKPQQPAAAKPAPAAAAAAGPSIAPKEVQAKRRIVPEAMHANPSTAAANDSAGPAAKKPKRITPVLIEPAAAGNSNTPSAPVGGDADKGPKRITPTPVAPLASQDARFEAAKTATIPAAVTEAPASGAANESNGRRRITPMPVGETAAVPAAAAAPAPALKPGSIAAMAMAAGLKAAEEAKKQ